MEKRGIIRITSKRDREFSTKLSHEGSNYYIITDKQHLEGIIIKTSIYKGGKHLKTITQKVSDDVDDIEELMSRQHQSVVERIKKNRFFLEARESIVRELNRLISKKNYDEAIDLARQALNELPDDPLLNSYYGYLLAQKGLTEEALRYCRKAIKRATRTATSEMILPTLYLHLGKVQLLQGDKRSAINSFRTGLGYDSGNEAIINELTLLGIRCTPVIPFLSRDHVLNKYLGLMRARFNRLLKTH